MPGAALSIVVLLPATTFAHAGLVSATPELGSELAIATALVILPFTVPLNVRLSDATMTTPDGKRVTGRVINTEVISVRLPEAEGVG